MHTLGALLILLTLLFVSGGLVLYELARVMFSNAL